MIIQESVTIPETIRYTVQSGDTLYTIAKNFKTSVSNIVKLNTFSNLNDLYIGLVLTIPKSPPGSIVYAVQPADSLYLIAQRFHTNINDLMAFNYLTNPNLIYPGQYIVITPSHR